MRTCTYCGDDFSWERAPGQRGRPALYCSPICKGRAAAARRSSVPVSPERRSELAAASARVRWASVPSEQRSTEMAIASAARYSDEQRERSAQRTADRTARRQAPCPYCGDPVGRAGRVKCPKPECNLSHNAARMGIYKQDRRARKAAAFVERVDPQVVYERDGWICGICNEAIDRDAKAPARLSPSVDHIVPLSKGGAHSYVNVRATHLYCNCARGNRD